MDTDLIAFESMLAAQETAKWTYWMMFATWFAGFATLSAVVVSLYLANRKPISKIDSSISGCITSKRGSNPTKALVINVSNVGVSTIVISSVHWSFDANNKIVQMFEEEYSDKLPTKLGSGESASYYLFPVLNDWAKKFLSSIEEENGNINKLHYHINLGVGKSFKFAVDQETIKLINMYK
ncbi:hypothetical protein ACS90Y_001640 [Yersinia enterocolitica]|uniref:hypothetical protein n=1 Tax=Yersinia enterocolitica TaxID=630 RepID=UPI0038B80421|nr:hypothetical protein [Yersinia enterocolitica]EKN6224399.1 hypothetical protein [Yersinia enterocolitica]